MIPVKVDTHDAGLIRFANGAIVTLVTSFDVWNHWMPIMQIYGTDGSLNAPDPNNFGGEVKVATQDNMDFHDVPLVSGYVENMRGMGVSELALALEEGRVNNASGRLGLHVLEIMDGFVRSSAERREVKLESSPSDPVPLDWSAPVGELRTK